MSNGADRRWFGSEYRRVKLIRMQPNVFPSADSKLHERRMIAQNEFWTSEAIWQKHGAKSKWVCVRAEKPIQWMKGMQNDVAKRELERMGATWSWL